MTETKIQPGEAPAEDGKSQAFLDAERFAMSLPGGWVKKIVWDAKGGYPEHAWGVVQYSPRPFRQGYGCDGTTDKNVHLVALTLCRRAGLDEYKLMLSDLYQINNRTLVVALEEALEARGIAVKDWWLDEDRLRAWKRDGQADDGAGPALD